MVYGPSHTVYFSYHLIKLLNSELKQIEVIMIRVSNHEDFQNAVFDESNYAQIRYQAIPNDLFTVPMLNKMLEAFGRDPVQMFPEDITEKQFLLNEIEVAVNGSKWQWDQNFFLIVGGGKGQLIHSLQQADPDDLEEQEETARKIIAKYPKIGRAS